MCGGLRWGTKGGGHVVVKDEREERGARGA